MTNRKSLSVDAKNDDLRHPVTLTCCKFEFSRNFARFCRFGS